MLAQKTLCYPASFTCSNTIYLKYKAVFLFPHPFLFRTFYNALYFLPPPHLIPRLLTDPEAVCMGAIFSDSGGGHQGRRTESHEEVCLSDFSLHIRFQLCSSSGEFYRGAEHTKCHNAYTFSHTVTLFCRFPSPLLPCL